MIIDTKRRLSLFANNQYTLKDLTSIGAFTRWRSNANQWSGGTSVFGNNNYKEYRFNVGYALKIENNFYFGVAANAWHFSFREKEANLWLLSINPALNYQYKKIEIGVNLKNIGLRKNAGNFLQESISIGFGYRLPNIQLLTEVEKFVNRPLLLKCALDYTVSDNLSLQYGFAFGNFNQYAGIRYLIKTIWLEFAIYHQSNLGSSSGFAIEYSD